MKILHTSDWHLGQQFYEHNRAQEQQVFLQWLTDVLLAERIDILLVSGDIYHTATPPASAEKQLYTFVKQAKQQCPNLHIVIIAGNHDSANRIEAAKPLLHLFDTHVVGKFNKHAPEEVVKLINTQNGPAHIIAMPFLRVADMTISSEGHYQDAVQQAYEMALAQLPKENSDIPTILMGHLHAKGGDISSDSERNITIGGFEAVNASIFPEQANYVALGHLHKAQSIAKSEHIRYSGTPLPMSFSERNYKHQVLVIEFCGKTVSSVKPLYVPRYQQLIVLPEQGSADLETLCEQINNLTLDPDAPPSYLRLRLISSETNSQFRTIIDEALASKPVLFCGIERVNEQNSQSEVGFSDIGHVEQLDPLTLLSLAYQQQVDAQAEVPEEIQQCLNDVISSMDEDISS